MDLNKAIREAQKIANDLDSSVRIEITITPQNKSATESHLNSDSSKGNVPPIRTHVNGRSLAETPPPPPPTILRPRVVKVNEGGCLIYVFAGITSVIGTFYWIL